MVRRITIRSLHVRRETYHISATRAMHLTGQARSGRPIDLGPTEYRLLEFFLEHPGRVFSREQLLDSVWGRDIYIDERTVDVHIGRLRKLLNPGREQDPIRTVRGAGYALDDRFDKFDKVD